jgi:hypothetical protein
MDRNRHDEASELPDGSLALGKAGDGRETSWTGNKCRSADFPWQIWPMGKICWVIFAYKI